MTSPSAIGTKMVIFTHTTCLYMRPFISVVYHNMRSLDPTIWGPQYWFVLQTIALCYPPKPNAVTKKKYYDFIQNLPLFLPNDAHFVELLDRYPVSPYLEGRESFLRWVIFIHNKMNAALGKPELTIAEAMEQYYEQYTPQPEIDENEARYREKMVHLGMIICLLFIAILVYRAGF